MKKKTFVIDGNNFSNLEEFYNEVERVLTSQDKGYKIGRNLHAFNDVLYGGHGKFEIGESIILVWKNSEKSKKDFVYRTLIDCLKKIFIHKEQKGPTLFEIIIEIIKDNKNVELILE